MATDQKMQTSAASHAPIPVTLENGPEKFAGFIMKLTTLGLLVELDKIPFKVGSYVTAVFELEEGQLMTERVRSIKHYKDFYRARPKKSQNEPPPAPKQLCELHFHMMLETNRVAITKYLLKHQKQKPKITKK